MFRESHSLRLVSGEMKEPRGVNGWGGGIRPRGEPRDTLLLGTTLRSLLPQCPGAGLHPHYRPDVREVSQLLAERQT